MAIKRTSIRLNPHERKILVELYLNRRIPVDQYEPRRNDLVMLASAFCKHSGRQDSPEDVLHYMRTQRKRGRWVKLDGKHVKRETTLCLSADEKEVLIQIYRDNVSVLGNGSDTLAYEPEVADLIAKEFASETSRIVPAHELVAELTLIRKVGLLPGVEKEVVKDLDVGFDDIEDVG